MEICRPVAAFGEARVEAVARALTTPRADPPAPVSQARLYMNEATHRLTLAAPSSCWLLTAGKCSSKRLERSDEVGVCHHVQGRRLQGADYAAEQGTRQR